MKSAAARFSTLSSSVVLVCMASTYAAAQPPQNGAAPNSGARVEAVVTVGWGRLWRWESQTRFGSGLNIGGTVIVRGDSGVGLSVGVDRTLGVASAPTAFSTNLRYYFRSGHSVQPYLMAGLGALWIDKRGLPANAGRADGIDVGFGPNLGMGLAYLNDRATWSLPEVQWLEGSWLSPFNLSITRVGGGAGYSR